MVKLLTRLHKLSPARSVLIFRPRGKGPKMPKMAGTVIGEFSTQAKLERARAASALVAQLSTEQKNDLLLEIANALEVQAPQILRANAQDTASSGLSGAMRDRLLLTPERIREMANAVRDVAE